MTSFMPTQIAGNILWLRADLGITLNGSNVSAWADQSSSDADYTQGTAANQPAYITDGWSGQPVVRFDGTNDFLAATVGETERSAYHAFFAVSYDVANAARPIFSTRHITPPAGGTNTYFGQAAVTGGKQQFFQDTAVPANLQGSTTLVNGQRFVAEFSCAGSGAGRALRKDGATDASDSATTTNTKLPAGQLGKDNPNASFHDGDLAEVIMYSRVLSAAEAATVRQYLGARYGITVV